jgi:ligand-binding sensor domain-containing protein
VRHRGWRSAPPVQPVRLRESKTKSRPAAVEAATCMTGHGLIATCFVCLLIAGTGRAHGLDPRKRLTQYRHNVWRVQDGFFPGTPDWVSQTADGYLWVGTWSGTVRFDGVRFVPWSPPASASNHPFFFVPAKSGGFWIDDGRGLSHIRGDRIVSHINLDTPPGSMVEEEDGSLWVTARSGAGSRGPLCHATDREVSCFGKADGLPIQRADSILPDGTGGLWIGSDTSLVHWKAGKSEIYEPQSILRRILVTCQKRQLSRRGKLLLLATDGRSRDRATLAPGALKGGARLLPDATIQYAERMEAKENYET